MASNWVMRAQRTIKTVVLPRGAYKQARDEARLADAHRHVVDFLTDFFARTKAAGIAVESVTRVVLRDSAIPVFFGA